MAARCAFSDAVGGARVLQIARAARVDPRQGIGDGAVNSSLRLDMVRCGRWRGSGDVDRVERNERVALMMSSQRTCI